MSRNSPDFQQNNNRSEGSRARDSDDGLLPDTLHDTTDQPYYPRPVRSTSSPKEPIQHALFSIFSESTSSLPPKELHHLDHKSSADAIMAFSPPSFESKMANVEEPISERKPSTKPKTLWQKLKEQVVGESEKDLPPAAEGIRRRIVANVALADALHSEKPDPWGKGMLKLYVFMFIAFFNSYANGYCSTVMGGINAMEQYRNYFDIKSKTGSEAGLILAMYAIGSIAGSFLCGPLTDLWGRRWGMFHGSIMLITGACIQGFAYSGSSGKSRDMFMLGRFILGFGIATNATAGPCYVAEMAHPAWRGVVTGMYNTWFFVGGITATWISWRTAFLPSQYSWRLPILIQIVPAAMIMVGCIFIPETPRWLFSHDRQEEAIRVLTKYHGKGNRRSPIVVLTLREMIQHILVEGSDKRWWDYSDLYSSRAAIWRLMCVGGMAFFGQWAGNGATTYFMPVVLEHVGIIDQEKQLLYNAILNVLQFCVATLGSFAVDKYGRRPLMIITTAMFIVWWLIITSLMTLIPVQKASDADEGKAPPELTGLILRGSKASIAMIYLFALTYSFSYTPLQTVYPVECLRYEMRAKGMGFSNLLVNIAAIFNSYGIPHVVERVGWKLYWLYVVWNAFAVIYIWAVFVETGGRTLEEINEIFVAHNPKKKSLQRHVVDETDFGLLYRGLMEELQNMEGIVSGSAPSAHVAPWTTQRSNYDPPPC